MYQSYYNLKDRNIVFSCLLKYMSNIYDRVLRATLINQVTKRKVELVVKVNKNKKIIIGILIVVLIIVIGLVIAYKLIENSITNRADFNFTVENITYNLVETVDHEKNKQNYSKVVDNIKLELNIPNEWKYEELQKNEENASYKYALKLYKTDEDQYAMLYFYNNEFGVCGTGRTSENITLNNGEEANIGYYDENENWSDISFYNMNKNIAVINYGLINTDADEVIEFIKTINITENN